MCQNVPAEVPANLIGGEFIGVKKSRLEFT
jgi:hypothetical protein